MCSALMCTAYVHSALMALLKAFPAAPRPVQSTPDFSRRELRGDVANARNDALLKGAEDTALRELCM